MAGFKELDFNERRAASQNARAKALAQLKDRPPVDEAEQARRRAAAEAREAAEAEKRRRVKEAQFAAEEAARSEQQEAKASAASSAEAVQRTEEERKTARDAKYAARKKNKAKRSGR
jgi:hypothetical protein